MPDPPLLPLPVEEAEPAAALVAVEVASVGVEEVAPLGAPEELPAIREVYAAVAPE